MGDEGKTTASRAGWLARRRDADPERTTLGLVIAWYAAAPSRVGEIALLPEAGGDRLLGRGPPRADDPFPRLRFGRQRPGVFEPRGPLEGAGISRRQLRLTTTAGGVRVERLGSCPLWLGAAPIDGGSFSAGDVVMLEDELVLACVTRPNPIPPGGADATFPFGAPDAHGFVGESAAAWELRDRLAFVAERPGHVLLLGESGSGKELAARAIHALSGRRRGPFVARNAATLPTALADAELFGHAKNYPNTGMPERPGLLGEAAGGTLFLDEAGELPPELQAHLLRVLDAGGEYHQLGDPNTRRANVRVVAATNRPESALKHDFAARFLLKLKVPRLDERREDIPLLVRHVLLRAAAADASLGKRFIEGWGGAEPEPRIDPRLVERLLRHAFTHEVRELESLLWTSMSASRESFVGVVAELEERLATARLPSTTTVPLPSATAAPLTRARIEAVLEAHGGNQERAFRALGLPSRDALYRLIKKHGIRIRRSPRDE